MLVKYDTILWDWNGTLFDDVDLCVEIINQMLAKYGLNRITVADYKEIFSFPIIDYYHELGFDTTTESFKKLSVEFRTLYDSRRLECGLHPHARDVLQALGGQGKQQAILSAYTTPDLKQLIHHFELEVFFGQVAGLDNIYAHSKVNVGHALLKHLACEPSKTVLIGDTLHDLEVAQEIGIDCILFQQGHNAAHRFRDRACPQLSKLSDLTRIQSHTITLA